MTYHGAPPRGVAWVRAHRRIVAQTKTRRPEFRYRTVVRDIVCSGDLSLFAKSASRSGLAIVGDSLYVHGLPVVDVRKLKDWMMKAVPVVTCIYVSTGGRDAKARGVAETVMECNVPSTPPALV